MTNLPLATPELDHDSLREILSLFSTTVRDKGYSPPPIGTGCLIFSIMSKESCTSTSSVTHQPHLLSCSQTMSMDSSIQNNITAQLFLSTFELKYPFPSLLGRVFYLLCCMADLSLSPNYLISFLPQQGCVGLNPNSWSGLEALQMGTLSHILINS
jgi:hypothetical protein